MLRSLSASDRRARAVASSKPISGTSTASCSERTATPVADSGGCTPVRSRARAYDRPSVSWRKISTDQRVVVLFIVPPLSGDELAPHLGRHHHDRAGRRAEHGPSGGPEMVEMPAVGPCDEHQSVGGPRRADQ